jgi:serine/threonine protein kinase
VVRVVRKSDKQFFAWKKSPFDPNHIRPDQVAESYTLTNQFNSPFVVRVEDIFIESKTLFIVLDYCAHGSLREKIQALKDAKGSPFSEKA